MKIPSRTALRPPANSAAATENTGMIPAAPDRSKLRVLDKFRVNRHLSHANRDAVIKIEERTLEAATDVAITAIEHRRSEQKAALASAAVVRYGAHAQELVVRSAVAQEHLSGVQFEGFKRLIAQRRVRFDEVHAAVARGELTPDEGAAVIEFIQQKMEDDSTRLDAAATRAKDAVDDLAVSATNHISRLKDSI